MRHGDFPIPICSNFVAHDLRVADHPVRLTAGQDYLRTIRDSNRHDVYELLVVGNNEGLVRAGRSVGFPQSACPFAEECSSPLALAGGPCRDRLSSFKGVQFRDAESLIRFHDALLFLRAFPQSRKVVQLTENLLTGISKQLARLQESADDLHLLDSEQFSGIAGQPSATSSPAMSRAALM